MTKKYINMINVFNKLHIFHENTPGIGLDDEKMQKSFECTTISEYLL